MLNILEHKKTVKVMPSPILAFKDLVFEPLIEKDPKVMKYFCPNIALMDPPLVGRKLGNLRLLGCLPKKPSCRR